MLRVKNLLRVSAGIAVLVAAITACSQTTSDDLIQTQTLPAAPTRTNLTPTSSPTTLPATEPPAPTSTSQPPSLTATRLTNPTTTPDSLEIASVVLTDLSIDVQSLYSPDRGRCEWERLLAYPLSEHAIRKYDNQFYTNLTVRCYRDEEVVWHLIHTWVEATIGYHIPDMLGWSPDGSKLYFHDSIIPDGPQPIGGFQENLRELELESGDVRAIPFEITGGISLSPDSRYVAYYDNQTMEIGIYDLVKNQEHRIPFQVLKEEEIWYAGYFTWSPDGKRFLVFIQYGLPFPTGGSIRLVDLASNTIRALVEKDERILGIVEWTDPDQAVLSGPGMQWRLDLETGDLEADLPPGEESITTTLYLLFGDDEKACLKPGGLPDELVVRFHPFCFFWNDTFDGEEGFELVLEYTDAEKVNETFVFQTGANAFKLLIPESYAPDLNGSQELCLRRKSFVLMLYVIQGGEKRYITEMAHEGECNMSNLPAAAHEP